MIDIILQHKKNGLDFHSPEDREQAKNEYKHNELVRCKCTRLSKAMIPSVVQNNLLHAVFQLVADNTDDAKLNTKEKVKFACKVALDFRHQDRVAIAPDGSIVFEYRSFNMDELKNMERLNIFQRGFDWCADTLGCTVDELVAMAQDRMQRR